MSKARRLVLVVGPLIIFGASAAGAWLTQDRPIHLPVNQATFRQVGESASRLGREGSGVGGQGSGTVFQTTSADARALIAAAESASRQPGDSPKRLDDACRRAAAELDEKLRLWPGGGEPWTRRTAHPFVLAGIVAAEELERWYTQTIRPAARLLAERYFGTQPDEPITVLLLPDDPTYRQCAIWLFGDADAAYFGYYRPQERTLLVNIGTGGGTLVHELTHALMAFDFSDTPDWFNEGLASLYEQCRLGDEGGIEGLVNWRLPELQQAIRAGRLRPLAELMTTDDFRGRREGINYAQARYFCLYLQERGVLRDFYVAFRATRARDAFGTRALQRFFPKQSIDEVDTLFRRWVLTQHWTPPAQTLRNRLNVPGRHLTRCRTGGDWVWQF